MLRVLCVFIACATASAFVPAPRLHHQVAPSRVVVNIFGGGGGGGGDKTPLVFNGKRKEFAPGSPLMKACNTLGMKVKTNCKKGDCGTCTVSIAGKRTKACIGKVPPAPTLKSLKEKGLVCSV